MFHYSNTYYSIVFEVGVSLAFEYSLWITVICIYFNRRNAKRRDVNVVEYTDRKSETDLRDFRGDTVVRLPMQGTRVRSLVREDPMCRGATKPMSHNYWACALEPAHHNNWARAPQLLSPRTTTTEARVPRARAPQQEKPPQWEACAPQQSGPRSPQLEKAHGSNKDPTRPKINKNK